MFVHSTAGTFTAGARAAIASDLTDLGMDCEKLAKRDEVREGVWVIFSEFEVDFVFRGGVPAPSSTIVLEVFALEGGLGPTDKTRLIGEATKILQTHASGSASTPTYVVINETPESDWGMLGKPVRLAALRAS
ncbi:4-oxalocrotonate tautomerase family protein [Curtobacterium flaccumfaciens]|jgi:phenylpyruvate tautomerase PptA (4-oxalocrotonate tautomerase family)|uniref:4-oxalocrotonate tautomerase family protein n=1 Tax=Curtobacterium flaccumfaciens TaxID=2035 RepID=UPI0038792DB0